MDRARVYRGLRIAWSVGCGVGCVLLIVLWIRSYSSMDVVLTTTTPGHVASVVSLKGKVGVSGVARKSPAFDRWEIVVSPSEKCSKRRCYGRSTFFCSRHK